MIIKCSLSIICCQHPFSVCHFVRSNQLFITLSSISFLKPGTGCCQLCCYWFSSGLSIMIISRGEVPLKKEMSQNGGSSSIVFLYADIFCWLALVYNFAFVVSRLSWRRQREVTSLALIRRSKNHPQKLYISCLSSFRSSLFY